MARQQLEADSESGLFPLYYTERSHYSLGPLSRRFPKVASLPCISQREATIHLAHCLGAFRKWPLYPILQKRSHYSFGPLTRRFPKVASLPCISQREATIHLAHCLDAFQECPLTLDYCKKKPLFSSANLNSY